MKILQIINSHALADGGAQRLAVDLHRAYRARGHDAHLLSILPSPTDEAGTYSLGFRSVYRGAVLLRLIRFLRQKRWREFDVIHVHLFPAQLWVALVMLVLKLLGVRPRARLVTTEHSTFNRRRASFPGRILDRLTLRAYEKIICVSAATQSALEAWQPQARSKLTTIENGIDLTRFELPERAVKNEVAPLILSVGRIAPYKNYTTALRAIALLKDENFRFQIAGQDEMNGQMQQLARDLGVASKVEFLGYQSDIPALLGAADIFLMSSQWEGFGLAVVEAMAAGLPVIVPDVPGVREVVQGESEHGESEHGENEHGESAGFLIDPGSAESVVAALSPLLRDAELRRNAGERARNRARDFDILRTIEAHLRLFEEMRGNSR